MSDLGISGFLQGYVQGQQLQQQRAQQLAAQIAAQHQQEFQDEQQNLERQRYQQEAYNAQVLHRGQLLNNGFSGAEVNTAMGTPPPGLGIPALTPLPDDMPSILDRKAQNAQALEAQKAASKMQWLKAKYDRIDNLVKTKGLNQIQAKAMQLALDRTNTPEEAAQLEQYMVQHMVGNPTALPPGISPAEVQDLPQAPQQGMPQVDITQAVPQQAQLPIPPTSATLPRVTPSLQPILAPGEAPVDPSLQNPLLGIGQGNPNNLPVDSNGNILDRFSQAVQTLPQTSFNSGLAAGAGVPMAQGGFDPTQKFGGKVGAQIQSILDKDQNAKDRIELARQKYADLQQYHQWHQKFLQDNAEWNHQFNRDKLEFNKTLQNTRTAIQNARLQVAQGGLSERTYSDLMNQRNAIDRNNTQIAGAINNVTTHIQKTAADIAAAQGIINAPEPTKPPENAGDDAMEKYNKALLQARIAKSKAAEVLKQLPDTLKAYQTQKTLLELQQADIQDARDALANPSAVGPFDPKSLKLPLAPVDFGGAPVPKNGTVPPPPSLGGRMPPKPGDQVGVIGGFGGGKNSAASIKAKDNNVRKKFGIGG